MRNSLEATGCRELLGDGLVPRKPGKEVSMQERLRSYVFIIAGMGLLTFAGCGGGPTGTPPTPTAYTIGGTVSGLSGRGLMLQDNGGDDLPVSADEAFTFTTSIPSGGVYAVTVLTQPSSPAQSCVVTNGSGTATADVTSVQVACTTTATGHNEWTWQSGSDTLNQPGVYGTQGMPAASNTPGARLSASTWTDAAGNLWLFGGYSFTSSTGVPGELNDLWKYSNGEWTWIGGSNGIAQPGVYGTQGTPAPGNVPGGRDEAVSWTDASGNFWLFGGAGIDSTGVDGWLNDLWKYSPTTNVWTWMGGSDTVADYPNCRPGVYGTEGVPAPGNVPGARSDAVSWTDTTGNLWLFGGLGYGATVEVGGLCTGANILNDLWKYSPGTNVWTWMSGSNGYGQVGTYGTMGIPSPGNVPGARGDAATWTDSSGNLWLFGGEGQDSNGILCQENGGGLACDLNDLWKYSDGQWTWMGGSDVIAQAGVYGIQGTPAAGNVPGARWCAVSWTDTAGNLWLFGGSGFDSLGTGGGHADLNDLWEYSAGQWTWMSGSDTGNQFGVYGPQGMAAPSIVPGGRENAVGWIDQSGKLWLFGGFLLWAEPEGKFNDLWVYRP